MTSVTVGIRTTKHPCVEFRQTPAGRIAYLRGVRLPVWLAVETVEDCGGDVGKAAKLLRLPSLLLEAALTYAKAFPDEIEADREAGRQPLEELDGREHAGIVFYDPERFKAPQIGALALALAAMLDHTQGRLTNRWITLR